MLRQGEPVPQRVLGHRVAGAYLRKLRSRCRSSSSPPSRARLVSSGRRCGRHRGRRSWSGSGRSARSTIPGRAARSARPSFRRGCRSSSECGLRGNDITGLGAAFCRRVAPEGPPPPDRAVLSARYGSERATARFNQLLIAGVVFGLLAGLGVYTFVYAKGGSYLDQRPGGVRQLPRHARAVRRLAEVAATTRSRPATTATRRTASSASTATKARNGFWHSYAFTTGASTSRILITAAQPRGHRGGVPVVPRDMVDAIDARPRTAGEAISCVRCHGVASATWSCAIGPPRWRAYCSTARPERRTGAGPRRAILAVHRRRPLAALAVHGPAREHLRAQAGGEEPVLPRRGARRRHRGPGGLGQELPPPVRRLRRTVDQVRTRYGGSEAVPRTPTAADPRSVVAQSRLEEDPRLKTMWAGYAFADGLPRGARPRLHARGPDLHRAPAASRSSRAPACTATRRSTCRTSKLGRRRSRSRASRLMNQMPYAEARKLVTIRWPASTATTPKTMQLRVTRPGFIEGIRALKARRGRAGLRPEHHGHAAGDARVRLRPVPRRVLLQGAEKRLTYPWAKGLQGRRRSRPTTTRTASSDWTHAETGAPVLKAQHPEFEMWNQGIHARSRRGLRRLPHALHARGGAQDQRPPRPQPAAQHQPRLPDLPPVARGGAAGARETIQERTFQPAQPGMDALVELIDDIKAAQRGGRDRTPSSAACARLSARRSSTSTSWRPRTRGLPRAAGGGAHPGRGDRLRAAGPGGAARPCVQAPARAERHGRAHAARQARTSELTRGTVVTVDRHGAREPSGRVATQAIGIMMQEVPAYAVRLSRQPPCAGRGVGRPALRQELPGHVPGRC